MSNRQQLAQSAPLACTLGADDLKSRFAEIGALAGRALLGHEQVGRRLQLSCATEAAADLERLVAQEQDCCAFLQFELRREADAIHLAITAPIEAGEFAPLLYAHFVNKAQAQGAECAFSCACASAGAAL